MSATELAVMGATLADGGVNPLTRERVVDAAVCHFTLAVMTTAGMYETSGDWLYDVGVPARAASAAGSWSSPRARGRWPPSPRRSTPSATASRASSRPGSCPAGWG